MLADPPASPPPHPARPRCDRLDKRAQDLLAALLAMDPSKRISAKTALDNDYFWEAPYPAKPEDLPKYAQSHEFTAKKRRQDAAKAANAGGGASQPAAAAQSAQLASHSHSHSNGAHPPHQNAHPRGAPFNSSYNKRPRDSYESHNSGGYAAARRPMLAGG